MTQMDEKATKIATMVIIHAGNARALVNEAVQAIEKNDSEIARSKLDQANAEIRAAHQTQTELIQGEARGEGIPITLLLTHAQDSLMAAMSEAYMARHIIKLHGRIRQLEEMMPGMK